MTDNVMRPDPILSMQPCGELALHQGPQLIFGQQLVEPSGWLWHPLCGRTWPQAVVLFAKIVSSSWSPLAHPRKEQELTW